MRIHFKDLKRPKFVAKQVRDCMNQVRSPDLPRIGLSQAQALTARMFGYKDWHELSRAAGTKEASKHDEDCQPDIAMGRRQYQARALTSLGVQPDEAMRLAQLLAPSGRHPGRAQSPSGHALFRKRFYPDPSNLRMVSLRLTEADFLLSARPVT